MKFMAAHHEDEKNQTKRPHQAAHFQNQRVYFETVAKEKAHQNKQTYHEPNITRIGIFVGHHASLVIEDCPLNNLVDSADNFSVFGVVQYSIQACWHFIRFEIDTLGVCISRNVKFDLSAFVCLSP